MKKILKAEKPLITSFPSIVATMIALQSKQNHCYPWIFSHYIQLVSFNTYYRENWPMHIVNFIDAETSGPNVFGDCNLLKCYNMPRRFAYENFITGVDFIEYSLLNDFYVQCTFNQRFNKSSHYYLKSDFMHSVLIYGLDENFVYLIDFVDGLKFEFLKLSHNDFNNGFISIYKESDIVSRDYYNDIKLFRVRDVDYNFDIEKVRQDIYDYINSCNTSRKYSNGIRLNENMKEFGIAAYNNIIEVICLKEKIDIRPFHVLYDHKVLMKKRIQYMIDNDYITDKLITSDLLNCADETLTDTFKLRNYMVKNAMLGYKQMDKEDFMNKIWILKSKDIKLMKDLLKAIK